MQDRRVTCHGRETVAPHALAASLILALDDGDWELLSFELPYLNRFYFLVSCALRTINEERKAPRIHIHTNGWAESKWTFSAEVPNLVSEPE